MFGCEACMHVSKDERSKLDVKTKQCIFIGYGQDEFGYHFYNPIDKKLIKSRDVAFFEDQTIEDIEKIAQLDSHGDQSLVHVDRIPIINISYAHEGTQGNNPDNDQSVEHIIVSIDDVVVDNQPTHVGMTASDVPETSCRRSTREKRNSTSYSHDEFILLTNMGEPEGYDEIMLGTNINKWKELIVDNHEFLRSMAGKKPV